MASEKELLTTEIVNHGVIEDSGPYAGSLTFLERVRRRLTRYSQICEAWLCLSAKPGIYFAAAPVLVAILGAGLGKQLNWEDMYTKCDFTNAIYLIGFLCLIVFVYLHLTPPST